MTKTLILAGALALIVSPALAAKVTAYDGRKEITVGGKKYELSGSRTKITIGGKAGDRGAIKVGMDCDVTGAAGGEASAVACK